MVSATQMHTTFGQDTNYRFGRPLRGTVVNQHSTRLNTGLDICTPLLAKPLHINCRSSRVVHGAVAISLKKFICERLWNTHVVHKPSSAVLVQDAL